MVLSMGTWGQKYVLRRPVFSTLISSFLSISTIGALGLGFSTAAFAQEEARQFSAKAGEVVNDTIYLNNNGQIEAALKKLESIINDPDLNAYERATIYQMMGHFSYELDRPKEAQRYFERALDSGGLLPREADNIRIVIAQIMIGNGKYREGAERLEKYMVSSGKEDTKYVELLTQACVQAEDYACALPWAEKWFAAADPKERRHYDLMHFLYDNLGMQVRQADLIKEMINLWPEDPNLWTAWMAMLEKGGRKQEAFEISKMLYLGGGLTDETDLLKLVHNFDVYDMPYQAAELLEREMATERISTTVKTQKQLGSLYSRAREYKRAAPILETVMRQSGDVGLGGRLAAALSKAGSCETSEAAFKKAVTRGYDADHAKMLIGWCYNNQVPSLERLKCNMTEAQRAEAPITKAREAALAAFKTVKMGSKYREDAQTWIKFIEGEAAADERRCGHIGTYKKIERHLCYQKIKQAYDAMIFTGGEFKLADEDKACLTFKDAYDAKYTVKKPN